MYYTEFVGALWARGDRLLEIALDICREKRKTELELFSENNFEHCINSEFDSDSMSFVAASAAYFGDRRFLTLLFDKGYHIFKVDSTCAVIIDRIIRSNYDKLPFFKRDSMCSTAADEIMRIINIIRMNDVTQEYMSTDEENQIRLQLFFAV